MSKKKKTDMSDDEDEDGEETRDDTVRLLFKKGSHL